LTDGIFSDNGEYQGEADPDKWSPELDDPTAFLEGVIADGDILREASKARGDVLPEFYSHSVVALLIRREQARAAGKKDLTYFCHLTAEGWIDDYRPKELRSESAEALEERLKPVAELEASARAAGREDEARFYQVYAATERSARALRIERESGHRPPPRRGHIHTAQVLPFRRPNPNP
jgi:hypothetical protein